MEDNNIKAYLDAFEDEICTSIIDLAMVVAIQYNYGTGVFLVNYVSDDGELKTANQRFYI